MVCRALVLLLLTLPLPVHAAGFVEPEVEILHMFTATEGSFGWAVSAVADLDGDGAMDVLTGAPFHGAGGMNSGKAYAYSSGTGELLFEWTGKQGDALGYAIADAGDLDGDGIPEIVVGAAGFKGPGHALIYNGADGELLHDLAGEEEGASLGSAVAGAGDVDDDGTPDLLVGAEGHAMAAGRVYLYSGATFQPLWTRDGDAMNSFMGSATAGLGDIDGDGTRDVVVGARGAGQAGKGSIYVLSGVDGSDLHPPHAADAKGGNLGHFFVGDAGDLDGDGASEVYGGDYSDSTVGPGAGRALVWSGRTGELRHDFKGEHAGDGLGCGRGGGDADHDGVPDLSVGSYNASPGGVTSAGSITLFSGATGQPIRTITGTTPGEQIGFDVVTLGDVDGDTSDDLVLSGAQGNHVYIVAGLPPEAPATTGDPDTTGEPETTTTPDSTSSTSTDPTTTSAPTTLTTDASTTSPTDLTTTTTTPADDDAGCSCRTTPTRSPVLLLLLALTASRRRKHWGRGTRTPRT